MYKTIIWATDGSDGADAALREALTLASFTRGHIVAVHAFPVDDGLVIAT